MNQTKRQSIPQWENHFNTVVLDADGFPKGTTRNTLFTEQEFIQYCVGSTIMFNEKILKAMDDLRK